MSDFLLILMFNQMKDLYKLQKQAKEMKKVLKTIEVEAEENGIVVVVNAAQDLISIDIPQEMLTADNKKNIEKSIQAAFARAIKKSQEVAAEKMKPLMGGMGLPGAE